MDNTVATGLGAEAVGVCSRLVDGGVKECITQVAAGYG